MKRFGCIAVLTILAQVFMPRLGLAADTGDPARPILIQEAVKAVDNYLASKHQSEEGKFLSFAEYYSGDTTAGIEHVCSHPHLAKPFGLNPFWEICYEEITPSANGADHFYVSMEKEVKVVGFPNHSLRIPSKQGTSKPAFREILHLARTFVSYQRWYTGNWQVRTVYYDTPLGEEPNWFVVFADRNGNVYGPPILEIGMDRSIKKLIPSRDD